MSSFCSSFRILAPQWRHKNVRFFIFLRSKRKTSFVPSVTSSSTSDDSVPTPKQSQLRYDPSEELFGVDVAPKPRNDISGAPTPRSWFGPNGQYIRELPCPSCRGRGYTPCTECGIERTRLDCSQCNGKSLNAKTGLFSKRMKIIHSDPKLHAQRVAAIKKAKGTTAARRRASEALKAFFSDPENRRKRSIAMKGVKFYCRNCGREGHRRHYCLELKDSLIDRRFKCRLCGEEGHNRRTCRKSRSSNQGDTVKRNHRCRLCHQSGHNRRTCPQVIGVKLSGTHATRGSPTGSRTCTCQLCRERGHNIRTCPRRIINPSLINPQSEEIKE